MDSFENYKKQILTKASDEDVLNEIGYCYKKAIIEEFSPNSYWAKCYYFLKGLAHYRNIIPLC